MYVRVHACAPLYVCPRRSAEHLSKSIFSFYHVIAPESLWPVLHCTHLQNWRSPPHCTVLFFLYLGSLVCEVSRSTMAVPSFIPSSPYTRDWTQVSDLTVNASNPSLTKLPSRSPVKLLLLLGLLFADWNRNHERIQNIHKWCHSFVCSPYFSETGKSSCVDMAVPVWRRNILIHLLSPPLGQELVQSPYLQQHHSVSLVSNVSSSSQWSYFLNAEFQESSQISVFVFENI